jgi:hypothetical protein
MYNGQMELGLGKAKGCSTVERRQRRLNRAQYWFRRMRRVVDCAVDWQPAPAPRPEQLVLPGTHRAPLADANGEQYHVCA